MPEPTQGTQPAEPVEREDGARLQDPLDYERGFWSRGVSGVAGVDEVGRGPLAGPVVAAAVVLPPDTSVPRARDSKTLTAEAREEVSAEILRVALGVGVGAASVREIDRHNILQATTRAMERALRQLAQRLPSRPEHVVVDGLPVRGLTWDHDAVVGGDGRIHCVSCASIVAKVCRDRLMARLHARYPDYGWDRNSGYGTSEHRDAIDRLGLTPHHRSTFGLLQLDLFKA